MATPFDVFVDGLREAYHAAGKFEKALAAMAGAAQSDKLRSRLYGHRDTTRRQIERIKETFESIDKRPSARAAKAADVLAADAPKDDDLAIVIHAIKIEHFELAMYEGLSKLAEGEKLRRAKSLLKKSMSESESAGSEFGLMLPEIEKDASRAAS